MIKDKEIASCYLQKYQDIIISIRHDLQDLQGKISPEEKVSCNNAAGHVIYEIFDRVFDEIFLEHPDLTPPGYTIINNLNKNK